METKPVKIKLKDGTVIDGVFHKFNGKEWLSDMMGNVVDGVVV